MRAEIDFVDPVRGYVRVWASEKFMRSFLLEWCDRISVADNSLDLTLNDGTRYLLIEDEAS
jgi:hypothetical protein